MDRNFWLERWRSNDIGFHQADGHDLLHQHWDDLNVPAAGTVLVPLSGKSRDLVWLADRGHHVVGIELSAIAIAAFFSETARVPQTSSAPGFTVSTSGPYTMLCGDMFDCDAETLGDIAAVYDRAALIALTTVQRRQYAATLTRLLTPGTAILLISVDYPDGEIQGPPFAVPSGDIEDLFSDAFEITTLSQRDGLAASDNLKKRGVTRLDETAYKLVRRP